MARSSAQAPKGRLRIDPVNNAAAPTATANSGEKGEVLQGELLDTRTLNGIVSYEPSELVVTVRAGTPLLQLEQILAERGQCLAFEPPHFGAGVAEATVGGMVAAVSSGFGIPVILQEMFPVIFDGKPLPPWAERVLLWYVSPENLPWVTVWATAAIRATAQSARGSALTASCTRCSAGCRWSR